MTQRANEVRAEFFETHRRSAPIRIWETLRDEDVATAMADLAPAVGLGSSRLPFLRPISVVSSHRARTRAVCSFPNPGFVHLLARANELLRAIQTILDDLGALGFANEKPSPESRSRQVEQPHGVEP